MTSDAGQKGKNLRYAIMYKIIWANQKTGSFVNHRLCTLATSFPAILSGIGHHFKRSVDTSIISNSFFNLQAVACFLTWVKCEEQLDLT